MASALKILLKELRVWALLADSISGQFITRDTLRLQAQQWIDEINEKAPQLRTALYHGPNRLRDFSPMLLVSYDVVLTTYHVLSSEFNAAPQGALYRVRWHRCSPHSQSISK